MGLRWDHLPFIFPFQNYIVFVCIFVRFFAKRLRAESLKIVVFPRRNAIFYKLAMFDDNVKKHRKNLPQTLPKPAQNLQKSIQHRKKTIKYRYRISNDSTDAMTKINKENTNFGPIWLEVEVPKGPYKGLGVLRETHSRAFGSTQQAKE